MVIIRGTCNICRAGWAMIVPDLVIFFKNFHAVWCLIENYVVFYNMHLFPFTFSQCSFLKEQAGSHTVSCVFKTKALI